MMNLGVVIIGRNEGDRLLRCFASIGSSVPRDAIVYVDSGSTDQSVALAQTQGVLVVRLDPYLPFSAGRARNEGFNRLISNHPDLNFVHFIDGDCEVCDGWFDNALSYLSHHERCGVVAGRTIEKYPEKSIYNLLCDLEWQTPFGIVDACGGIFMIRKDPFVEVGGFNLDIPAGEEPELCYRLCKLGWEIHCIDHPMVIHDAAMTRFSQWWKRSVRGGQSYAQGVALHGRDPGKYCLKDSLRIWLWGLVVPIVILFMVMAFGPLYYLLIAAYPVQLVRVALRADKRFENWRHAMIYAFFNIMGKWPQLVGQISFWVRKILRKPPPLIEYK